MRNVLTYIDYTKTTPLPDLSMTKRRAFNKLKVNTANRFTIFQIFHIIKISPKGKWEQQNVTA